MEQERRYCPINKGDVGVLTCRDCDYYEDPDDIENKGSQNNPCNHGSQ